MDIPPGFLTESRTPDQVDGHNQDIGKHGDHPDKLGEFARSPRAFEVFAAIEDSGGIEENSEDVLLNYSSREKSPGIFVAERRDEREVRNDLCYGAAAVVDTSPAGDVVEKGQTQQTDKEDASNRRDVDSERHVGELAVRETALMGDPKPHVVGDGKSAERRDFRFRGRRRPDFPGQS